LEMSVEERTRKAEALDALILRSAEAVAREPRVAAHHYDLGRLLAETGRHKDAERCFTRAVKLAPDFAAAHHDLGVVLKAQGRFDDALACYMASLQADSGRASTWINIGLLHVALERHALAEAAFRSALDLDETSAKASNNLGLSLQAMGRDEEAAAAFAAAVAFDQASGGAAFNLGQLRERQGAFAEAARFYREALLREPAHALARANLVELADPDDSIIAETTELLETRNVDPGDQALLDYALAKHFDQHGAHDNAWRHVTRANQLRQRIAGAFDAAAQGDLINRLIARFSKEFFDQRKDWGSPDQRPLFIVGMPRSGTTLLEQILASHPEIHGAGELEHFALYGQDYPALFDLGAPYPECVGALPREVVDTLAEAYTRHLASLDPTAAFVSNKTPLNFLRIGLIKLIFPNAVILHCKRDPRDSLLSIYFQNFAIQQTLSTDLKALGHYYLGYDKIMTHWSSLFASSIFDVKYHDVAMKPAPTIHRVLKFLGLPWDEACLAFHQSKRRVDTPSLRQVRQPIYKSSLERWKYYEDELQPLLKILEPVLGEWS